MVSLSNLLLRTPPWLVALIWFAPSLEVREWSRHLAVGVSVSAPSWSSICFFFDLAWYYALYSMSRSHTPLALRDRHGAKIFAIAIFACAAFLPLGFVLYEFEGQPPGALVALAGVLIATGGIFTLAAIAYAAEAMHKAQIATGQKPEWHPLLALLFFGIGIWFIHRPIQALLAQPKAPTQ